MSAVPPPPWANDPSPKPGDRVMLPCTLIANAPGIGPTRATVQLDDGSTATTDKAGLIDAQPKPLPENLAVVHKADLRELLAHGLGIGSEARRRLRAAMGEPDVRSGDVWKDKDGTRWFCRHDASEKLHLASEDMMGTMSPADVSVRDLELEWRRGDG